MAMMKVTASPFVRTLNLHDDFTPAHTTPHTRSLTCFSILPLQGSISWVGNANYSWGVVPRCFTLNERLVHTHPSSLI